MADFIPWPALVNTTILAEGYNRTSQSNIIITNTDTGPQQRRRRYTAVPMRHTIQLRLENSVAVSNGLTEFQLFEQFVKESLYDGIANTQFPLPWNYTLKTCFFYFASGSTAYSIAKIYGTYVYVLFTLEEVLA